MVFGCLVVLLDEVWALQQHFPTPYSNRGYSNTIATSTKRSVHAGNVSALYRVKKDAWLIILVSILGGCLYYSKSNKGLKGDRDEF